MFFFKKVKSVIFNRAYREEFADSITLISSSGIGTLISFATIYLTFRVYTSTEFALFYQTLLISQILRPLIAMKLEQVVFREKKHIRHADYVILLAFSSTVFLLLFAFLADRIGVYERLYWCVSIAFLTLVIELTVNLLLLESRLGGVVLVRILRPASILVFQLLLNSLNFGAGLELGYLLGCALAATIGYNLTGLNPIRRFRRRLIWAFLKRNQNLVMFSSASGFLLNLAKSFPYLLIVSTFSSEISGTFAYFLRFTEGINNLVLPNARAILAKSLARRHRGSFQISFAYGAFSLFGLLLIIYSVLSIQTLTSHSIIISGMIFLFTRLAILPVTLRLFFDKQEYFILAETSCLCLIFCAIKFLVPVEIVSEAIGPELLFLPYFSSVFFYVILAFFKKTDDR